MRQEQPSQTARGAAAYRAIHQILEGGAIFKDPFASRILDEQTAASLKEMAADACSGHGVCSSQRAAGCPRIRWQIASRPACVRSWCWVRVLTRFRCEMFADLGVRVFEVDYAATQSWKRERIKVAGLVEPQSLIFAPTDFERESLSEGLTRAGFRLNQPAFFQWLGVVPYLTREAVSSTLKFISKVPQAVVVFDYAEPFQNYPANAAPMS